MREIHETQEPAKKAFLIGVWDEKTGKAEAISLARELRGLSESLGLVVAGEDLVHLREHSAKFGMGSGKAAEIAERCAEAGADCLVFDCDLGPSQQRNWEELTGISCLDRHELIIEIFAGRAQTREAALQVELARLSFSLPRLSHKYIDLARQRGGHYGAKGSGETKLETDRRLVMRNIAKLQTEIEQVRKQRAVQRKRREKGALPVCALVGYTNAGKSSLLNALTGADALVENKLFATLDTTSRRLEIPGDSARANAVLLVDTVGFIRRLPHALIDAFRATMEEVALADMLVLVLDASDPDVMRHFETTLAVLADLGASDSPMIIAFNKIDRVLAEQESLLQEALRSHLEAETPSDSPLPVFISVAQRRGLDILMERIADLAAKTI
jgi:GTP-binding protein HflX